MKNCPTCLKKCDNGEYIAHLRIHQHIAFQVQASNVRDAISFNDETRTWECNQCKTEVFTNPDIHALWHQIGKVNGKKAAASFLNAMYEVAFTDQFYDVIAKYLVKYLPLTKADSELIDEAIVQAEADREALREIEALAVAN